MIPNLTAIQALWHSDQLFLKRIKSRSHLLSLVLLHKLDGWRQLLSKSRSDSAEDAAATLASRVLEGGATTPRTEM